MTRICWICGNEADSAEHKIKKSDLVRVHGTSENFRRSEVRYLTSSGLIVPIQGPNSTKVKYKKVICSKCNNEKTQKADLSYEKFQKYLLKNKEKIIRDKFIFFEDVYGASVLEGPLDLFRYATKAMGCRIADAEEAVPEDLSDIINKAPPFETRFWVCVAINEDEIRLPTSSRLGIGNLICVVSNDGFRKYAFAYFCEWIVFTMWYGLSPIGPVGGRWAADLDCLCLGSYSRDLSSLEIVQGHGTTVTWPGFES